MVSWIEYILQTITTTRKRRNRMDELLQILSDIHPEIDFETYDTLVDDKILDSFDIVSVIPAEEIIPENFNSAEAIYDLIERIEDE